MKVEVNDRFIMNTTPRGIGGLFLPYLNCLNKDIK